MEWARGDRVALREHPAEPGTITQVQGQGQPFHAVWLTIAFDCDPGRPVMYRARECTKVSA